jgi:hypothetical protein
MNSGSDAAKLANGVKWKGRRRMETQRIARWLTLASAVALIGCSGAATPTPAPTATANLGPTQTIGALQAQISSLQATISAPTAAPAATATPLPPTVTPTSAATATPTRTPAPPTATRTVAPTAVPTQASGAKVGETARGQGYAVTMHEFVDPAPAGRFSSPKPGFRWVAFDVTVENTGTAQISFNPFYFTIKGTDNREYSQAFGGMEPSLNSGQHQPGEATRGWVTFEVPEGLPLATLTYDPTFGKSRVLFDLR